MDQTIGKVKAFGFVILQLFLAAFYPVMACSQKTEAKVIKTIDGNTTAIADVEKYLSGQMPTTNNILSNLEKQYSSSI
ncbi:hypothetical protein ACUN24_20585 [Pedobacter sp. WC2501]|uniref:hypothetical protein n=1 Tax=Pedobacter sp. WC2501 TaxID=3461400 RepID=UPI004045ED15